MTHRRKVPQLGEHFSDRDALTALAGVGFVLMRRHAMKSLHLAHEGTGPDAQRAAFRRSLAGPPLYFVAVLWILEDFYNKIRVDTSRGMVRLTDPRWLWIVDSSRDGTLQIHLELL